MVGMRIKALREARGVTLSQLAEKVGVSIQAAWNWESNPNRCPSTSNVVRIADALGVTTDEILRSGTTSQA